MGIDHAIEQLVKCGCSQIIINTHHLNEKIDDFIQHNRFKSMIKLIHEPEILGTGGAIANVRPFLQNSRFFVINSDIISSIDLRKVYDFHKRSDSLATLVLHDHEKFNKVAVDDKNRIIDFNTENSGLAFTGIQVLSPEIFSSMPDKTEKKIFSSIEIYEKLTPQKKIKAFIDKNIFWSDIGTIDSYSMTSLLLLAASQFNLDLYHISEIEVEKLAGDGSDRKWYRVIHHARSFIVSDHDICMPQSSERDQINAFINIGNHLSGIPDACSSTESAFKSGKICTPAIYNYDKLSGMVILEDLGNIHLETIVNEKKDEKLISVLYRRVIDKLIDFSIHGFKNFKKEWTCQTPDYSKELILEKECCYFLEYFIQKYLKVKMVYHELADEFNQIADNALKYGFTGLMHRDMQSRNIMVSQDRNGYCIHFIDFQGARSGPLQYDLASLLIDPYVNLDDETAGNLLLYAMEQLKLKQQEKQYFIQCFHYCCLTRNMQILGAFSFLTMEKNKKTFEQHIPAAVKSIKKIVTHISTIDNNLPKMLKLVEQTAAKW